jgi:hypothetical protein
VGDLGARGATCGQVKTVVRHWSRAARYQHAARFTPIEKEQTMSMNDEEIDALHGRYRRALARFAEASKAADRLHVALRAVMQNVGHSSIGENWERRGRNGYRYDPKVAVPSADEVNGTMAEWQGALDALRTAYQSIPNAQRAGTAPWPEEAGPQYHSPASRS